MPHQNRSNSIGSIAYENGKVDISGVLCNEVAGQENKKTAVYHQPDTNIHGGDEESGGRAYIDNFSYNFQDWIQPLPFGGAKLCSFRDTDQADVESRPWFGQKENNLVWKQRLKKAQLKEIFLLVNLL